MVLCLTLKGRKQQSNQWKTASLLSSKKASQMQELLIQSLFHSGRLSRLSTQSFEKILQQFVAEGAWFMAILWLFFFFPPWQQSSCSQRTCLCPIFGPNITWPLCPIEFFFISLKEKSHKKKTFCRCCWGEEKNDRGAVGHHRRWILKILINGIKVWTEYQWQRKVLWREWKIFVLGIPLYTFPS